MGLGCMEALAGRKHHPLSLGFTLLDKTVGEGGDGQLLRVDRWRSHASQEQPEREDFPRRDPEQRNNSTGNSQGRAPLAIGESQAQQASQEADSPRDVSHFDFQEIHQRSPRRRTGQRTKSRPHDSSNEHALISSQANPSANSGQSASDPEPLESRRMP